MSYGPLIVCAALVVGGIGARKESNTLRRRADHYLSKIPEWRTDDREIDLTIARYIGTLAEVVILDVARWIVTVAVLSLLVLTPLGAEITDFVGQVALFFVALAETVISLIWQQI